MKPIHKATFGVAFGAFMLMAFVTLQGNMLPASGTSRSSGDDPAYGCYTYNPADSNLNIPDGSEQGVTSTITTTLPGYISAVTVTLTIKDHTYVDDLIAELCNASGCYGELFAHDLWSYPEPGYTEWTGTFSDYAAYTLRDEYEQSWGYPMLNNKVWRPNVPLGKNMRAAGQWHMHVIDPWAGDTGRLKSWQLTLCTGPQRVLSPTPTPATATPTPTRTPTPGVGDNVWVYRVDRRAGCVGQPGCLNLYPDDVHYDYWSAQNCATPPPTDTHQNGGTTSVRLIAHGGDELVYRDYLYATVFYPETMTDIVFCTQKYPIDISIDQTLYESRSYEENVLFGDSTGSSKLLGMGGETTDCTQSGYAGPTPCLPTPRVPTAIPHLTPTVRCPGNPAKGYQQPKKEVQFYPSVHLPASCGSSEEYPTWYKLAWHLGIWTAFLECPEQYVEIGTEVRVLATPYPRTCITVTPTASRWPTSTPRKYCLPTGTPVPQWWTW